MSIVLSVAAAFVLGAAAPAPAVPSAQQQASELPAGHPPIDPNQLPPGHPPLDGAMGAPARPGAAPTIPGANPSEVIELLRDPGKAKELLGREKTFEVAAALGKLYFSNLRYREAADFLEQAWAKAEPARALYLEQSKRAQAAKKPLPTAEEAGCLAQEASSLEGRLQKAREQAKAGNAAAAARCARSALEPALAAQEMRARALFLLEDPKGATAEYTRVLELDNSHGESLYGLGNVLLDSQPDDPRILREAKQRFERLLATAPGSPRAERVKLLIARLDEAISAGGTARLVEKRAAEAKAAARPAGAESPPPLSREVMEAAQAAQRTPEGEQGLDRSMDEGEDHLAHGRYQEALDAFKRVMPVRPDGRTQAGMAWALIGLDRQPMADRVWSVAVSSNPAAVDKLGEALKAKGDVRGARALWSKLASSAPEYAKQARLEERLNQ